MIQTNHLQETFRFDLLGKRAVQGALLAVVLLSLLLTTVYLINDGNFDVKSKISTLSLTVGLAGALGGIFFYLMNWFWRPVGGQKTLVAIAGVLVYLIGLWLGLIYGLSVLGLWD